MNTILYFLKISGIEILNSKSNSFKIWNFDTENQVGVAII